MKNQREDAARTRKSLLYAAGEIFAAKGFRDTTIAEISSRAGVNIAAVNYHFGSKETLYIEAWRCAFIESLKAYPPDGGVSVDAPAEERLRGHVTAMINRLADENNKEFWFIQREFANPTGLLEEVMREEIHPLHKKTQGIVRELLGSQASEEDVQFCEISIVSQCLTPMVAGKQPFRKDASREGPPQIRNIKAYAEHVVKFSLAGIAAVQEGAKSKGISAARNRQENE